MPPRSRYAVDPSLTAQAAPPPQYQEPNWQQPQLGGSQPVAQGQYFSTNDHHVQHGQGQGHYLASNPQLHPISDRRTPPPTGTYAPTQAHTSTYHYSQPRPQPQHHQAQQYVHPSLQQPVNHIPPPPHSSGLNVAGPRIRIDPTQVPNPVEAQELDQNLFDDEEFLSCNTRGVIPLAGTDWRGIDQGNSLPRYLRATLPVIPTTSQLLETTALPFALVIQPFAALRYDEAPVPLVSNWVYGESAFDAPRTPMEEEEDGPPRCEKCRGYVNPWVRWTDGGRKWGCNLCGTSNNVSNSYFSNLAPNGQRLDHQSRPELLHGTVDFPVPRIYWSPQPPPTGSLIDTAVDTSTAAVDALTSTAADLLGGLQSSLGQTPTRGPSPAPGYKEKEKERKEREKRLRRPMPIGRVFVLDVSNGSVARGVVREVCEGIRRALYGQKRAAEAKEEDGEEEDVIGRGERVAIVTVAQSVGFWNLSPSLSTPSLSIVSDLDDMFIPFMQGFLVDPLESRTQIEALLNLLPDMMERQPDGNRVAAGAGVRGALAGLRMLGGQITLFLSQLSTIGPGKLSARDDPTTYNTDKERALFATADPFWRTTSEELAECGIGANLFLFPEQYTDVASVGTLCAVTGGETFFHPKFSPVRDRDTLYDEIKRIATRETVYNATLRIRCSNGLRVSDHVGNFYQRSLTDLEFGTIDDAKALVAVLKHEGQRLDERNPAFVQIAVLYTSADGQRRVRCLNMSFSATSLIGNVFRFADLDTAVTVYAKEAVAQMPSRKLEDVRKALTERCNRVLLMYRRHCAAAVSSGQLILPEGFKLLPLYTLCMLKSKPLKGGNVTSDVRAHYMRIFKSASVVATMNVLYPRLLAIHDLTDDVGFPGPNGRLKLPRFMRASFEWMVADGAYLLSNGEVVMIWLGGAVNPQIVDDLYGVENMDELDVRMGISPNLTIQTRLPKLPTLLSTQVRNLLTHLERIVGHTLPVIIVRQNMDGTEIEYANALMEDSNNDALSYTDYLMTAHKAITNELSGSGKGESWRPW